MTSRGMGAREVRPGYVIRDVLSGEIPVVDANHNESVTDRAAVNDLHRTYKALFQREVNGVRLKRDRVRPMTYWSFSSYLVKARILGLVEQVGTEPSATDLLTIRDGQVAKATRNLYALTEAGKSASDEVWGDISRAYQEGL